MELQDPLAVIDAYAALVETMVDLDFSTLTDAQCVAVLTTLETAHRRLPTLSHRILSRLQREASPKALGAKSFKALLTGRLRISGKDATRRLKEADELGPRVSLQGESLPPVLAKTAAAQAKGRLGTEHVAIIGSFFSKLPSWVDVATREKAEATLVRIGVGLGPEAFGKAADRLAAYLDQDGPMPEDADRARKRSFHMGPQEADGMATIGGNADPEFLATYEPLLAKFAAPGMCNPADEYPCVMGTPSQAQIDGDTRSYAQRVHDAMIVIGRIALSSGRLGQLNGLPVTVIVSTTLQDLQSAAGVAVTGGGSLMPMRDLIRLAAHAHHYLAVYDEHTAQELYLGRAKRLASVGQRLMLANRDRGCTHPGCTASVYQSQVHHLTSWAANSGQTNIDQETLACGGDNRLAEEGWTVRIRDGIVEWIPPPELDVGQPRINYYHHPERLLAQPDDEDGQDDEPRGSPPTAA